MSESVHAPMPDAAGLAEPMRSRWSPSVFDAAHELSDEEIATLLQAARWSASWGNTQPWRLGVARRGNAAHRALVAHLTRGNSTWVPRASVVFLAGTQVAKDDDGNGPDEPTYSYYDLGQAAAHLTLQARAMGLHALEIMTGLLESAASGSRVTLTTTVERPPLVPLA